MDKQSDESPHILATLGKVMMWSSAALLLLAIVFLRGKHSPIPTSGDTRTSIVSWLSSLALTGLGIFLIGWMMDDLRRKKP